MNLYLTYDAIIIALLLAFSYIALMWERHEIVILLREILHEIRKQKQVVAFRIVQFKIFEGVICMPITGVTAGTPGTFAATPLPSGAVLPSGNVPVWTASDPTVSIAPSPDGLSAQAGVPADSTLTEFSLTITAQPLGDGSQPSGTVSVPVTPAVVPPPQVTGFQIDQTA